LVLSSWTGVATAEKLNQRFGTPWLHWPVLPTGAAETSSFLRALAEAAGVDGARAEAYIRQGEKNYHYYFERAADFFLEFRWDLPSHYATAADAFYGVGIGRLLSGEFGLLPVRQYVTDNPPLEFRDSIAERYASIAPGIGAEVVFTADGATIAEGLRGAAATPPLVFGSAWDRDIAQEIGGCHLSISAPVTDRLVAHGSYLGYRGALRLIEDTYSSILNAIQ